MLWTHVKTPVSAAAARDRTTMVQDITAMTVAAYGATAARTTTTIIIMAAETVATVGIVAAAIVIATAVVVAAAVIVARQGAFSSSLPSWLLL
jgi:hypothetical protein